MAIHVFVDTNIFLNFFHYSKDDLEALAKIFASHEGGAATVHLTQQVVDEFFRNRENKIQDALKRFKDSVLPAQLPFFMRGYPEYNKIQERSNEIQALKNAILSKCLKDIEAEHLQADKLIRSVFENSKVIPTDSGTYQTARMRMDLGNPPGKNNKLGDSVNWELLLANVPKGEAIHIISEDGDYFSKLDENAPHPFLLHEWKEKKASEVKVYRTVSGFLKTNFDGVAFFYDKNKENFIEELRNSGSFARTHTLIAELEKFSYFSISETERLIEAAMVNNQVGWIITDADVKSFYRRVAWNRIGEISSATHREYLEEVFGEKVDDDDDEVPF